MPRSLRTMLVLAAVTAVLGGCAEALPPPPVETIDVTGVGHVMAPPDTALVELGAEARAPSLADAIADVTRRMTAVLARVKTLGVADRDVATTAWVVDPLFGPRRGDEEPRIAGYRVLDQARVRVRDLAALGRILDAAVAAGANHVPSLRFTLDDPARAESDARARAVAAAAAKASELARAAGVRLGPVVSLTEPGAPPPMLARAPLAAVMTAPPVEPGELEVTVTVQARYRIER